MKTYFIYGTLLAVFVILPNYTQANQAYSFSAEQALKILTGDDNASLGNLAQSCTACHTALGPPMFDMGQDLQSLALQQGLSRGAGNTWSATQLQDLLGGIMNLDSDGDGFSNAQEWVAATNPSDTASQPSENDDLNEDENDNVAVFDAANPIASNQDPTLSGGCGMIMKVAGPGTSPRGRAGGAGLKNSPIILYLLLTMLPLLLIAYFRNARRSLFI